MMRYKLGRIDTLYNELAEEFNLQSPADNCLKMIFFSYINY